VGAGVSVSAGVGAGAGVGGCAGPAGHEPDLGTDAAGHDEAGLGDAASSGDGENVADAGEPGDAADAEGDADGEGAGCGALPLCDGFETDTPGTPPSGWSIVMGCNPNTQDGPADAGGLIVGVDSSQHHGGNHSVRVVGGDSCGYYIVETAAFAKVGPQLYARFWVMFSGSPTQGHNGFLSMGTSGGDHFRLGFQDAVVAWNAQKSDATLPDMDPQGTSQSVSTMPSTWTCLEFHVDETNGHLELWLNGGASPVAGLSWDGSSVQGVDDQWAHGGPSPPVPTSLGLGWLGLNDQETTWFDDVALGNARIGCD
jgi:polysaccharide lyase-like protein